MLSSSGLHDCPEAQSCVIDVDGVPFSDTFTAIAAPGYRFAGWQEGLCGGQLASCVLQGIPVALTSLDVDTVLRPLFEIDTETDSDGDGSPDSVDAFPDNREEFSDRDGDGLGDNADPYPDDSNLPVGNDTPPGKVIINAYNADMVTYAGGAFVQLNDHQWVENNVNGTSVFNEVRRDEWSIYLDDPTRDVQIQLDLHRREILYWDPNTAFVLYQILEVNPDVITGWAANRAYYDDIFGEKGGFVQLNSGDWVQNSVSGAYFLFTEISRDDWSVYLQDTSRGVTVQLDYYLNQLKYSDATITAWVIGTITDSDPEDISAFVVREVYADYSYFLLNEPRKWVETLDDGTQYFFDEVYRDEWSVIMYEPSRDINVWIDLHTNVPQYSITDWSNWQLYEQVDLLPVDGPIAWYTFDGGTPEDASGRMRHLSWGSGYVYQDANGARDEALYLNGNNTSAIMPDGIVRQLDDFTVATFVKLDELEEWSRLFSLGTGESNQMYLTPMSDSEVVRFGIRIAGGAEQTIDGDLPLGGVNGYTAQAVLYNGGAFVRVSSKYWMQNSLDAPVVYEEVGRDEWSVYLRDASRQVDIQLDLHRSEVIFTDPSRTFVYAAITSFNPHDVNGFSATRIRHSSGRFSQLSPTRWVEDDGVSNNGTGSFAFDEVGRDEWSVYLYDANRQVNIQLDLYRKEIIYSDVNTPPTSLYTMTQTTPWQNENNWLHVAVTKVGNVGTLYVNGAAVGINTNMTNKPSELGNTTRNWIGKSQLASDPSFKGSIDDFRIYNRGLSAKEIAGLVGPDPEKITFMGSDVELTRPELKTALANQGYTLVDYNPTIPEVDVTQLAFDECVTMYSQAERDDTSGKLGVLACNSAGQFDERTISVRVIYGGCDLKDQGGGVDCEAGVYAQTLRSHIGGGVYQEWGMRGPQASACTAVSLEKTCLGGSISVADISTSFKSKSGSGAGIGTGVGLAAGGGAGFEDGVLNIDGNLKIGIGLSLSVSLSEEDAREIIKPGETAWIALEGEIVGVGNKLAPEFEAFGNEVHDFGNDLVGGITAAGETIVVYVEDGGQGATDVYNDAEAAIGSAAEDVGNGLVDTAGVVATGVVAGGEEVVTYVGTAVTTVVDYCTTDYRRCIPAQYGGYR